MNKILFKNNLLNAILGFLFIVFTILAYFLGLYKNFLSIIVGILLILLSIKRFIYTYKKLGSKKATIILSIELLLDILFAVLLIVNVGNVAVFTGLIIYLRGFTYLMINHIATRRDVFYQYLINIGFITLGSFFIFTGIPMNDYFVLITAIAVFLIGLIYFLFGLSGIMEMKEKANPASKNKAVDTIIQDKPKSSVKNETVTSKDKLEIKVDYSKMTLKELQVIAKNRNLSGITKLNKSEIIEVLNSKTI